MSDENGEEGRGRTESKSGRKGRVSVNGKAEDDEERHDYRGRKGWRELGEEQHYDEVGKKGK